MGNIRHTEPDRLEIVHRSRVEHSNTIPTGLDLDGQVSLETPGRFVVMENLLKWCVFQRCTVDIPRDPVVVEHRSSLKRCPFDQMNERFGDMRNAHDFVMIHVVCRTCDGGVLPSALPYELE